MGAIGCDPALSAMRSNSKHDCDSRTRQRTMPSEDFASPSGELAGVDVSCGHCPKNVPLLPERISGWVPYLIYNPLPKPLKCSSSFNPLPCIKLTLSATNPTSSTPTKGITIPGSPLVLHGNRLTVIQSDNVLNTYLSDLLYINIHGASRLVASIHQTQWYFSALLHASRVLRPPSLPHAPVPD